MLVTSAYLESESKLAPNLLVLGLNNCCFNTRSASSKSTKIKTTPLGELTVLSQTL